MKNYFALLLCLPALSSCVNSMGGGEEETRISGIYTLEGVDGAMLPATIAPEQGCNRTVREGTLTLAPGGGLLLPHYTWSFAIDVDCQPVPSGVFQGTDDVGSWTFHPTQLPFVSRKGHGTYDVAFEEIAGNPPAVTLIHRGNSYQFRRVSP
jgi:hypothetical protein